MCVCVFKIITVCVCIFTACMAGPWLISCMGVLGRDMYYGVRVDCLSDIIRSRADSEGLKGFNV